MAYTSALFNVSLAGPTLFGPVISAASLIASQSLGNNQQKYFVLLIITVSNSNTVLLLISWSVYGRPHDNMQIYEDPFLSLLYFKDLHSLGASSVLPSIYCC